jgi:DNA-binding NarL/FixJ family response regulator
MVWSAIDRLSRPLGRGRRALPVTASVNEWSKLLSPRERAVALLIAGGLPNKEVAGELGLSPGTVKIHVHSIFQKLGVRSRNSLIIRHGTKDRAAP